MNSLAIFGISFLRRVVSILDASMTLCTRSCWLKVAVPATSWNTSFTMVCLRLSSCSSSSINFFFSSLSCSFRVYHFSVKAACSALRVMGCMVGFCSFFI